MERRQILSDILAFKRTKGVLADFGGCPQAGADGNTLSRLNEFMGFGSENAFNEKLLQAYDIDTRGVGFILGPQKPHYKFFDKELYRDEWGVVRRFTGLYWDIVECPLKDKTFEEIERYPFPDVDSLNPSVLDETYKLAKHFYEDTDKIVVGSHPVYGIFELGCWMFGFEDFLYRCAAEPETVHMFFGRVLEYQKKINEIYYGRIGKYLHITTSGDDFATQGSTFLSAGMFDELIKPYFAERIKHVKGLTSAKFLHHSCGSVYPHVPSLIDSGVDILNPIQPCSELMSPQSLINAYGGKIVFHGGFDTQKYLPKCSVSEIKAHTEELLSQMQSTSHIFAAAHNIQPDVPVENINAMFEAVKEYKRKNG